MQATLTMFRKRRELEPNYSGSNMDAHWRAVRWLCVAHCIIAIALPAQKPIADSARQTPSSQKIMVSAAERADSLANSGDSLAAYSMLDSVVKHSKRDGPSWHAYGMLAWNMAHASRETLTNHSQQAIRWLLAADSALHLAAAYAPDSATYWRDIARFKMDSRSGWQQATASDFMAKAVDVAEKNGEYELAAETADEMGMLEFRKYETMAISVGEATYVASRTLLGDAPYKGFAEYTFAVDYFLRAAKMNSKYALARRHLYMAYAERANWSELLSASKARGGDRDALFARGLAYARLDRSTDAAAAFDSALTLMTPDARVSFTRITRLLPTSISQTTQYLPDSITFSRMAPAQQALSEKLIWALLDPLIETKEKRVPHRISRTGCVRRFSFYARGAGCVRTRFGSRRHIYSPWSGRLLVRRFSNCSQVRTPGNIVTEPL